MIEGPANDEQDAMMVYRDLMGVEDYLYKTPVHVVKKQLTSKQLGEMISACAVISQICMRRINQND